VQIELRDYQKTCVEKILSKFKDGVRRQAVQLPTGSGKTLVMGALAHSFGKKTLVLAHRRELIFQAQEKFQLIYPPESIGVCMGSLNELDADVVIASIQTCSRDSRLEELKARKFDLILVDEAHHASAPSYKNVIDSLLSENGLLLGVSATLSKKGEDGEDELSDVFEEVTYSRGIAEMISEGYLSPIQGRRILTRCNLGRIEVARGDFIQEQLSEAVNTPERNRFIVEKYIEHAQGKKAAAFCVDVAHCKAMAQSFNAASIPTKAVYGDMPPEERSAALRDFKTGALKVLTSCGVLLEGYDEPTLAVVLMARPTKSRTLYVQAIGRALRTHPSKECAYILDFTDEGHRLDEVVTLATTIPCAQFEYEIEDDEEEEEGEVEEQEKKERTISIRKECDKEIELIGSPRLMWVSLNENYWSLIDDNKNEIVIEGNAQGKFTAQVYYANGFRESIVSNPLPLDYCASICDEYARKNLSLKFANIYADWASEGVEATEKQVQLLLSRGINPEGMSRKEAALAIRRHFVEANRQSRQPCTEKQRWFLKNKGFKTDGLTKRRAQELIASIKSA